MSPLLFIPVGAGVLALLCLWGALRAARRQRLMADVPTCKTTGVFIGLVELKGTAEAERPLRSYLAERACVYYSYSVAEHWSRTVTETYTDSEGKTKTRTRHESGWKPVAGGDDRTTFYLRDECGVIRIQPAGAEAEGTTVFEKTCTPRDPLYYGKGPAHAVSDSDHRRRFHETAIPLHTPIYVVGPARERSDVVAPEIRHEDDAEMFLISARSEAQISSGLTWQYWLLGVLAIAVGAGGSLGYTAALDAPLGASWPQHVGAGAAVVLLWLGGWLWMAFNSLVRLRQRVRQAWSNVDVQLKRRADLIPNLISAVGLLRDHERAVQGELAELRAQTAATRPGAAGPDPAAVAPLLSVIVERYPQLTAETSFAQLRQALVDTENRIALARDYFNEIAAHYNARREIIPDRWIAAMARLQPQPLLAAAAFERAAVAVDLSHED